MAAQPLPAPPQTEAEARCPEHVGRPLARCECSGTAFADVARQVSVEGRPVAEVLRRTGCGQTCTACLGDLRRYLASSR